MRIDQTTPVRQLPTTAAPQEQSLSKTDWKTHALVILGYMLVGIGIALAFCAPYIAFTVQPMLAVTSPVLPIILGVLGIQYASEPLSPVKVAAPAKPRNAPVIPPIGIANKDAGNGWINASLQILFNVPSYKRLMEDILEKNDPKLTPLCEAYKTYKDGGQVDSQKIREWLHSQKPNDILLDASQQCSYKDCLDFVLLKAGYSLPKGTNHQIIWDGNIGKSIRGASSTKRFLDLSSHFAGKNIDISKALFHCFYNRVSDTEQIVFSMEKAPNDFGVNVSLVKEIQGAMETTLTTAQVGENAHYFCDGFISQLNSRDVAYFYKGGKWWEVNDSSVKSINLKEANSMLAKASYIHYTNSSLHPEKMKDLPPAGIRNAGANCWANTILQFIANAPSISSQILSQRNEPQCQPTASLILDYFEDQLYGNDVTEKVDSQLLRESIENVPKNVFTQIDVSEGIEDIFGKAGIKYEMVQDIRSKNGLSTSRQNVYMIDLDLVTSARSFKELFAGFFYTKLDDGQTKQLKFIQPPKDLVIKAFRYGQAIGNDPSSARRIEDAITGLPDRFELPRHLTQGNEPNIHYELVGCMIQKGALDSGHYISLIKKPNGWYLNDDSRVRKISDTDAKEELKKGYFFNYRKVQKSAAVT